MSGKKILIVDDSDAVRSSLVKIIKQKKEDLQIYQACDGSIGLSTFEKEKPFDLIFSDYNMPNMNGISMCKNLKEKFAQEVPPIVMLTTEMNKDLMDEGKKNGVVIWVVKPINAKALEQIIDRFLK
ncbi:MAG: response regulator [Oligoflexia bacterium]|nr:response regulator [Oligoflexia bacterium]